jgi:restriction endonuclease, S subunit
LNIGKTPPRDDSRYWLNAKRNWVSISDMTNYGRIKTTKEQISEEAANSLMRESSPINTLLMSFKLTVGRTAILDIEAYHNEAIVSIYPYIDKKFMLRNYLFYTLPILANIGDSKDAIKGKTLNSKSLNNLLIPLPPLNEQLRIVEKIEELIPHIEYYGRAQAELDLLNRNIKEQLKKSVLQYAIEGKLVPQDEAEGSAEELLLQIQKEKQKLYEENKLKKKDLEHSTIFKDEDNKYYEKIGKNVTEITDDMLLDLPVGWRWCRLKDIVFIFTGATFKKEEVSVENIDIRILRGGNIQPFRLTNRVDDIFLPKDKVKENILLKKNDIVTPAVTSLENIGKMARVEFDLESTTVGGFVFILRQFYCNDIVSKYLLALLSSPVLIDYIKSITNKSGQAFYNISKNRLEMTLLPLPPLAEQQRIVESIDAIFRCIEN